MRRRISWLVLATTSTVVASFVIPLCLLVRNLAEERAMSAADQEARNVAIVVANLHDRPRQLETAFTLWDQRGIPRTGVLRANGTTLGAAEGMAEDPEVAQVVASGESLPVIDSRGGRVLIPVVVGSASDPGGGTAVVRSSVTTADLHRGVAAAWAGILGLGAVLMLLALFMATRLGRRVSEPLRAVADVAHQLREGDLQARAVVRGTEETEELARALNGLADRTTELLAAERATVGDLSHRLRTPVTALRLDAEAVGDPELASRLQEHIATLQVTIDAIVAEARRPVRTDLGSVCDAAATVRQRVAFWQVLAEDQGRRMVVAVPQEQVRVPLADDDLADVVDVLIDNVFAHTPEGTPFVVTLTASLGRAVLVVADEGPGLAATAGRRERPGSTGLGLDIVRRTAAGVGGTLLTGPGLTGPGLTGPGLTGPGLTGPGHTGPGHTGPGTRIELSLPIVER